MEKKTKEQMLIELTKIKQSHEDWVSGDENRRKEFAKAFHWYKKKNSTYDNLYTDEVRIPTWTEIFVEIGKLLSQRDFRNYEGNISELECKLEDLEMKIKKEIHPNL